MKHVKKFVAAVVAVVMAMTCMVAMASCSSKEKDGYTANNTEFFIGCTGPLTGDAASYGNSVQKGATVAIEEINGKGGLNGVKFKFDIKDDQAEAASAGTGYDTLFEAGMQIALGSVTSGSCKAFAAKAVADNLFFMTPSASEQAVIESGDNAFRVCFGDPDQGTLAAEEIKNGGYTKVGAIYESSSSYSVGIYDAFKAEMAKLGISYVEQKFDEENNKDFSTQAEALKDCDVIFMPFYYEAAALFIKTAVAKGSGATFLGCDGLDGIAKQFTDADKVENPVMYITPFDAESSDAKVAAFVTAYKTKYNGETPDQFAADAYDAVMAIYEAMKAANVSDPTISASDLCELVKAKITDASFQYVGATGTMTWDKSGACAKVPQIVHLNK